MTLTPQKAALKCLEEQCLFSPNFCRQVFFKGESGRIPTGPRLLLLCELCSLFVFEEQILMFPFFTFSGESALQYLWQHLVSLFSSFDVQLRFQTRCVIIQSP